MQFVYLWKSSTVICYENRPRQIIRELIKAVPKKLMNAFEWFLQPYYYFIFKKSYFILINKIIILLKLTGTATVRHMKHIHDI